MIQWRRQLVTDDLPVENGYGNIWEIASSMLNLQYEKMVIFRTTDDQKVLCWLVSGGAPPLLYGIELGSEGDMDLLKHHVDWYNN